MKSNSIIEEKYKKVSCSRCNSNKIKKDGLRKTQNRGKIQRYKCKECGFRFVLDDGFFRMRNHKKKITLCLDLYYKGISLRKIQEHLQAFYPKNSSHVAIYDWIIRCHMMISKLTDNLKINVGPELMSDEMEYHRLGKQNWFVDVMDTKTRFMVSSEYMPSRTIDNLTRVLKRARFATGEQIKVVTTDGLQGYSRVLKKLLD